jgi:hypothetical protein
MDMGIDLRRADVDVPQHGLDGAEIGAVVQQVGGNGAPSAIASRRRSGSGRRRQWRVRSGGCPVRPTQIALGQGADRGCIWSYSARSLV